MKIIFFSCLYSENQKELFSQNSRRGYQYAAQNFQEAIINGMTLNDVDFRVVTIPSLSTFPIGNRLFRIKNSDYTFSGKILGKSLGYINLPFVNHPSIERCLNVMESMNINNNSGICLVLVYGLHKNLMRCAVEFKHRYPNVRLSIIIPDLPEFMGYNKYYAKLGLRKRDMDQIYFMLQEFDSYVVLTREMLNHEHFDKSKPYVVVEGIYRDHQTIEYPKVNEKVILYTGGLAMRYGIGDLVKSFHKIPDQDFRLWICGNGDGADFVKGYAKKDSRITYFGSVGTSKVEELQNKATLLVNPRHSNEVYTKYSFPSKTMEYMASGTPTLMSRLECIPKDYYEHLFFFEDESIEGMAKKMREICRMEPSILKEKGESASRFIKEKKNAREQVRKILTLFDTH